MEEQEKVLTFTTKKVRVLHVESFENYTSGCGMTSARSFDENKTLKNFYKEVLNQENKNRTNFNAERQRNIIYRYWVSEQEIMTDNRSIFGHSNQSSVRYIKGIESMVYVRGEVITIGEALVKSANNTLSEYTQATLSNFISMDLKLKNDNLKERELRRKIVMIPGDTKRETFFCEFKRGYKINVFPEGKLLPIKEGW